MLEKLARGDLPTAVRVAIRDALPESDVTLPRIARRLGVGVRTLQRRLNDEKLVYREVVEEVRRAEAVGFVRSTRLVRASLGATGLATSADASSRFVSVGFFFSFQARAFVGIAPALAIGPRGTTAARSAQRGRRRRHRLRQGLELRRGLPERDPVDRLGLRHAKSMLLGWLLK
jgi:hypothetical protein